ncbi:MAG: hypothetical protein KAI40_11285 [Desulfobacterales bacterium]|nr:hypothetical protein [Desulfobacterales bacterium]
MKKSNYHQKKDGYLNHQTNRSGYCGLLFAGFFVLMLVFSGSAFAADYPYPIADDAQSIMLNDSPVKKFQTSQYMSSISHSIPIFTPPGTGGLQPNIALTYNSQSVDQIGLHQQAGVAGLGWSISGISYIYIKDGKDPASSSDDIYGLSFGGTSYELEEDKDVNDKYHTIPASYLKILDQGTYWEVIDKSGTINQFGRYRNSMYYDTDDNGYRWNIDMVKDTSGNEMYFTYDRTNSGGCTQSGRIANIKYTYRSAVAVGNLRQVIFSYGSDRDDVYEWNKSEDDYGIFYETRKLDKITVQVGTTVVKEYNFGYDYSSDYVASAMEIDNGDFEDGSGSYDYYNFYNWVEIRERTGEVGCDMGSPAVLLSVQHDTGDVAAIEQSSSIDIFNPYSMLSFDAWVESYPNSANLVVEINDGSYKLAEFPIAKSSGIVKHYIPLNMVVGDDRKIKFIMKNNYLDGGFAYIDNVKFGSGPYLTLTSVTEKGTGSAALPSTKFVYEDNVLKYVQKQKTDSTWYNAVSYSISKKKIGGHLYTKLNSETVQNGFDATSPFYTSSIYSYDDDDSSVYDYVKKELIGYSETTVTDPDGNETKRYSFQDGGRRGLLDKVEYYDNESNLYSKITYDYENYYENKVNNHSFESGLSGWSTSPGTGSIYIDSMHYADGVDGVVVAMNRSTYNNVPELYQTVDLSGYASGEKINLWFYMWISANALNNYVDMEIKINDNGTPIYTKRMEQGFGDAELVEVDLTAYAGNSSVKIEFTMDGMASSGLASYHLDDVRIIPEDMSVYKPRLKTKKVWTYDGDADFKIARSDFVEYDDYGHVKKTTAYKGNSTDSSYQVHGYAYADVVYDLGEYIFRLAHTRSTDASGNTLSESWNCYDGSYSDSSYTGSYSVGSTTGLTKGRLTKTETRVAGAMGTTGNPKGYIQYDIYGNAVKTWDAADNWAETTYDSTYHTFPNVVTNELFQSVMSQTYDAGTGNLLTLTDANNQTATNVYDSFGRSIKTYGPLTSSIKPLSVTMYRGDGISDIDETGSAISDSISFPRYTITAARKDAYATTATYMKSYAYIDGLGRAIQTKSPSETGWIETNMIYNDRGQVAYVATPKEVSASTFTTSPYLTEKTSSVYDCLGRVTKVTTPDAKFVQTIYDDWTVKVIDQFNNSSRFIKKYQDAFGRVVQMDVKNNYHPDGTGTSGDYTYTSYTDYLMHAQIPGDSTWYPSVIKSTDAKGNISWAAADLLGRNVKTIYPDEGTWNYYYDSRTGYTTSYGNLIGQKDAKGNETKLEYDELNRLTKKIYPGTGNYINYTFDYYDTYDTGTGLAPLGHLVRVHKYESGSEALQNAYKYDIRGRSAGEWIRYNGTGGYYTYYSHDSMNRVNTITYPGGEIVKQTYGSDGGLDMLGTILNTDKYVKNINYDAFGRMTLLQHEENYIGGGAYNTYSYYGSSNNYRLKNLTAVEGCNSPATMMNFEYDYDAAGNITRIDSGNDNVYTGTHDQEFTYDYINRLKVQTNSNYAGLGSQQNYVYDSINRITSKNQVTQYYFPGTHQVRKVSDGKYYFYDLNGNSIGKSEAGDFNCDGDVDSSDLATFSADFGRTDCNGDCEGDLDCDGDVDSSDLATFSANFGRTDLENTSYTFDGSDKLNEVTGTSTAEYSYDAGGNRVRKIENNVTTYYVNKYYEVEDSTVIKYYYANGQRVAKNDGGTLTFYHADHLGGSSRITNALGSEIKRLGYKPYGEDAYSSGSGDEPVYKFTGKEQDATGLYYYGARYYDPALGRFISPDAYGDNYVYCNNNPLMYVDPDGNNPIPFLIAGGSLLVRGGVMAARGAVRVAGLAKKYAVPLAYVTSNAVNAYIYGCEKGYVNGDTQSKVNEAVNSVGQSEPVQYLANEMGIRFGYESVDARFYGMGVGDQFSKWGEIQGTLFDGDSIRIFLDDSGNPVESDWTARPSAMYWNKGTLLVWADMGNDTDIFFLEKEGMPGKGEFKIPVNLPVLKGIVKFDIGHMHYQVTKTENNTIYTIRPTAGWVSKINTIDSQAGIPKHLTATPFSRRGLFFYMDSNKYNSWKSDVEGQFWEKLGF